MSIPTVSDGLGFEHRRRLSPPGSNVYTSLRELMDSSPAGPFTATTEAGFEIRIRNPLVKQAAYAYLQMAPSAIRSQQPHSRFLLAFSNALGLLRRGFGYIGRFLCCSLAYSAW